MGYNKEENIVITLTPVGQRKKDIEYVFYVKWEEYGLFIHVTPVYIEDGHQEYNITFHTSDRSKVGVIKIGNSYDSWIRDAVMAYATKKSSANKIWSEIKPEISETLKKDILDDKTHQRALAIQVFDDYKIKVEE